MAEFKTHSMDKYGTLSQNVKFELDDWALVSVDEREHLRDRGKGLDCVHACGDGWCYALPENPECPGCGEIMPDVIQGMYQMANMDQPYRLPVGWLKQDIQREVNRQFKEFMKDTFLTGSGYASDYTEVKESK